MVQMRRRETNQISIEEKRRLSNIVIDNNGTLEELHQQIERHWNALSARQSERVHDQHCLQADGTSLPTDKDQAN